MQFKQDGNTFIIYIEQDESIMETLTQFCKSKDIVNAQISGIGAIKEIQIESIHKFKGLESEVVVMILPSIESLESETTTDIRSLIYVGMSRATSLLIIIGDQEVKALANWSS